jgi:RHS repeat-associated protein
VAQRIDYDEFGRAMQNTSPGFQPFGYAGGLSDDQTGLVRFGARKHDPATGRWITKDPLGFAGGSANVYTYVNDNPISGRDPTGLCEKGGCEQFADLVENLANQTSSDAAFVQKLLEQVSGLDQGTRSDPPDAPFKERKWVWPSSCSE